MNWAVHPFLYQVFHPWHWLTYNQNAAAASFVATAASFIILWLYTMYTRRMMIAAEETRRLSLTPYLIADTRLDLAIPLIAITNVAGPAVRCEIWHQRVSNNFELLGLRLNRAEEIPVRLVPSILATDSPVDVPIVGCPNGAQVLYVVECHDTANGLYQLQLLQVFREWATGSEITVGGVFVTPDTFLPLYQRVWNRLRQRRMLGGR